MTVEWALEKGRRNAERIAAGEWLNTEAEASAVLAATVRRLQARWSMLKATVPDDVLDMMADLEEKP